MEDLESIPRRSQRQALVVDGCGACGEVGAGSEHPERWVDDALFRIEVRDAYRHLVEQGRTDALLALHSGERTYTFWHYFRNSFARDAGFRIDHFLLSPSVADRLEAASFDKHVRGWEHTSDHAPVWIELKP